MDRNTHLLMIIIQNFLTLFDFVSAHLEQFQVYEGLAKETGTNETRQQTFLKHALTLTRVESEKKLEVRTHLRMASLLCILLSGELFCWLLNLEEIYLNGGKRKSEIALIKKYCSVVVGA